MLGLGDKRRLDRAGRGTKKYRPLLKGKRVTDEGEAEGLLDGFVDNRKKDAVAEVGCGNRVGSIVAGLGRRSGSDGWGEGQESKQGSDKERVWHMHFVGCEVEGGFRVRLGLLQKWIRSRRIG